MTMMVHKLVRLTGDEVWADFGDDWDRHLSVVCELSFVRGWTSPPAPTSGARVEHTLDWGATLYEVSRAELLDLITARPDSGAWQQEEWDAQDSRLSELPEDGRYGVIYMECY